MPPSLQKGTLPGGGAGSCPPRFFIASAVRLQLHALAYNLGNFLRTLATPEPIKIPWGSG
jgi:hypothetical protein